MEQVQEQEVDQLLNFVDSLDYENYVNDTEVNTMLDSLKQRIEQIKEEKLLIQKLKQEAEQQKHSEQDVQSQHSRQDEVSVARSVSRVFITHLFIYP